MRLVENKTQCEFAAAQLAGWSTFQVDTETTGLDPLQEKVLLLQIGNKEEQFIFDIARLHDQCLQPVFHLLEDTNILKLLHNAKFDYQMLKTNFNIRLTNIGDTMLLEQLLTKGLKQRGFSLAALAKKYRAGDFNKEVRKSFVDMQFGDTFTQEQIQYAAYDVQFLEDIYQTQRRLCKERNMWKTAQVEFDVIPAVAEMELNGIYLHREKWLKLEEKAREKMEQAREELDPFFEHYFSKDLFGNVSLNYNSPDQLKPALEKILDRTLKSTESDYLKQIDHPVIDKVLTYREYVTRVTRYGKKFLENIRSDTGRIHSTFSQLSRTDTGRFASKNPNCFSKDTEILTENGWVSFEKLPGNVKVAQYKKEKITFVNPTKYYKTKVTDELISIDTEAVKLLMTADHRVLTTSRSKNVLYNETAENFYNKFKDVNILDRKFIRAGKREEGKHLSKEERKSLQYAIIVQNEGWIQKNNKIEISFKSNRKKKQIKEVFKERVTKRGNDRLKVILDFNEVSNWITKSPKVFKMDKILELCYEDLEWMFNELHKWDGDFTRKQTFGQNPKRRNTVDLAQIIGILTNRSTKYYEKNNNFVVTNFHKKPKRHCSKTIIKKIPYNDYVYCVSVPSEKIIVRYKNQACVVWNCQNIPSDPEYRAAFTAPNQFYKIITADYAQIELRLLAEIAQEEKWLDALNRGLDLHKFVASHLYQVNYEDVTKEMRKRGKAINFGVSYGAGPWKLSKQLGIPYKEAEDILNQFFLSFPQIKKLFDQLEQFALKHKYAWSPLDGRRRSVADFDFDNMGMRKHALNIARNLPFQGLNATITKKAMTLIHEYIVKNNIPAKISNTVHDEIVLEVQKNSVKEFSSVVKQLMLDATKPWVKETPMDVDLLVDDYWVKD